MSGFRPVIRALCVKKYRNGILKILLTGFRSKESATNASDILISSFINELPVGLKPISQNLEFKIISDNTHTAKEELEDIIIKSKPSYCLFIGQAPGYNRVTLETIATNYRFTAPPVNIGEPPQGEPIEKTGKAAFNATLPNMQQIIQNITNEGIPASISHNCGNSLCNQILYHGLHYTNKHKSNIKCGFIHIPALTEQVLTQWPQHPFMPIDMTRKAIEIVVSSVIENHGN